jgi:hypothetical protein
MPHNPLKLLSITLNMLYKMNSDKFFCTVRVVESYCTSKVQRETTSIIAARSPRARDWERPRWGIITRNRTRNGGAMKRKMRPRQTPIRQVSEKVAVSEAKHFSCPPCESLIADSFSSRSTQSLPRRLPKILTMLESQKWLKM